MLLLSPWTYLILGFLSCGSSPVATPPTVRTDLSVQSPSSSNPDTVAIDLEYITGKFQPAEHPAFQLIPAQHADKQGMYLRKEAWTALEKMISAAQKDGLKIVVISATRNFERQQQIWEMKWEGKTLLEGKVHAPTRYPDPVKRAQAILKWSSMPGSSRHHWGTDFDINHLSPSYWEKGDGAKLYAWLVAHAHEYGFCQPYSPLGAQRPTGYQEEKWHWTYLPLSEGLTTWVAQHMKDEFLNGFKGAATAGQLQVTRHYMLGINKDCASTN